MPSTAYNLRQTSGGFLLEVLRRRAEAEGATADDRRRHEIACDVFIKQWSYAVLNKLFFWLALLASLGVLIWPALLAAVEPLGGLSLVASAVTQTMATAVAAFLVALYLHYKGRQAEAEALLRAAAFKDLAPDTLADLAAEALSRLDRGPGFRARTEAAED